MVLTAAFRGWQEEVQLQQYRRHVVVILSHKVNNGLLLKAFNCWRCDACALSHFTPAWCLKLKALCLTAVPAIG